MNAPVNTYGPTAEQSARALVRAGAYGITPEKLVKWKSGIKAPVYTNARLLRRDPGARSVIKKNLANAVRAIYPSTEVVTGMSVAGIMWSSLVADEIGLPDAFVRKTRKEHGPTNSLVDCDPEPNAKTVLIDDLVATGESLVPAVVALREEAGLHVLGVLSIVNWGFKEMHERFAGLELPVWTLVSYPQLVAAALEAGLVTQSGVNELMRFYADPWNHTWNLASLRPPINRAAIR